MSVTHGDGNDGGYVDLPVSSPTSCTFGGEALDRLYVTSARFGMDDGHLDSHPEEGALIAVDMDAAGEASGSFKHNLDR